MHKRIAALTAEYNGSLESSVETMCDSIKAVNGIFAYKIRATFNFCSTKRSGLTRYSLFSNYSTKIKDIHLDHSPSQINSIKHRGQRWSSIWHRYGSWPCRRAVIETAAERCAIRQS
ncbi:hypothetical protein T4C_2672 [Trichinella pseudospiralis]|uniref:Uncharacterized protein n=1 Tax=Trichinella pseudospiralis TaxID=6337 RepID=A0A0V1JT60_TRIPS|nr:hypothetical protein T4C_2672 [Trichinella pseudospiralis]